MLTEWFLMRSVLNRPDRDLLIGRLRRLAPESPAKWGRMSASQMVAHLSDQMRITLGDLAAAPSPGPLRLPILKHLVMYWLPWPKGRIKGPPEAFTSQPTTWQGDLVTLTALLDRFVSDNNRDSWPDHPTFGRLSRKSWGHFAYRHFDHHLRQFGV